MVSSFSRRISVKRTKHCSILNKTGLIQLIKNDLLHCGSQKNEIYNYLVFAFITIQFHFKIKQKNLSSFDFTVIIHIIRKYSQLDRLLNFI